MNRRKRGNETLKARAKKANAKLAPQKKPKYISKADKALAAAEPNQDAVTDTNPDRNNPEG